MKSKEKTGDLFKSLAHKANLKQEVYKNTVEGLKLMKTTMKDLTAQYAELDTEESKKVPFTFKDRGEFEAELKFGGDTLVFMMHTNVFEFPRDSGVMRTPYVREDKTRSYCGIINIFNFLSDSFKYNRLNDSGYLIGRVFVNKDNHCFVEGKRELGFIYKDFGTSVLDQERVGEIIESAIYYTLNFDLLTPPYDQLKIVSVHEFNTALGSMMIKTGKRLGFKFQADME